MCSLVSHPSWSYTLVKRSPNEAVKFLYKAKSGVRERDIDNEVLRRVNARGLGIAEGKNNQRYT